MFEQQTSYRTCLLSLSDAGQNALVFTCRWWRCYRLLNQRKLISRECMNAWQLANLTKRTKNTWISQSYLTTTWYCLVLGDLTTIPKVAIDLVRKSGLRRKRRRVCKREGGEKKGSILKTGSLPGQQKRCAAKGPGRRGRGSVATGGAAHAWLGSCRPLPASPLPARRSRQPRPP